MSLGTSEYGNFGAVSELTVVLSHGSLREKLVKLQRGRYWDRTSDLFRVKEARYPCANRPAGSILPQEIRSQGAGGYSLCPSTHPVGVCAGLRSSARVSSHTKLCACGCGAVVAHHLAKVRVASSNLVIRSEKPRGGAFLRWCGREARQRPAKPFTRVRIPSPPRITKYGRLAQR